jgi:hypothetical protein
MLRSTLRRCRPLLSAGKSSQTLFNRSTTQNLLSTPQYRSDSTDLAMAVQFPIPSDKFKQLVKRAQELGGVIEKQTTVREVYYDAVPEGEDIDADEYSSPYDITSKEEKQAKKDPEEGRAKPAPRINRPKGNHAGLYVLTKRDMWLVKQDGANWLLKVPATDEVGRTHLDLDPSKRIPVYREAFGERAIRRELSLQQDETLAARTGKPLPTLEQDLQDRMNVVPFASFMNTQYLINLPSAPKEKIGENLSPESSEMEESIENTELTKMSQTEDIVEKYLPPVGVPLSLELESTNFGYAVGRLSVLIENPDEEGIDDKMASLMAVLNGLAVSFVDRANSPILEYLERQRTDTHFKHLVAASVARRHNKPVKKAEEKQEE